MSEELIAKAFPTQRAEIVIATKVGYDFVHHGEARGSVVPHGYALADTARLFALINFAAYDGMIAGFDAKYHYGFWRPFHAIRLADTDGNSATEPDPLWTSLIPAPNHPEYISTHSNRDQFPAKCTVTTDHLCCQ